jgi:hypothetical protein
MQLLGQKSAEKNRQKNYAGLNTLPVGINPASDKLKIHFGARRILR